MCRNIRKLFNLEPPASDNEVREAALQFVRKISGFNKPSKANEDVFLSSVDSVTEVCVKLLDSLFTNTPPKPPKSRIK